MTKFKKIGFGLACALTVGLIAIIVALFRGYFDHGTFEVKQTIRSPSGRVAIVAERSDHEALSTDVHFVLIGDHVFSAPELRIEYHGSHVLFVAAADCVTVRWDDPRTLTVTCANGTIDLADIELQKRRMGDVTINYLNIPDMNSTRQ